MRKLRLVVDDLQVETFRTFDGEGARGTVVANVTKMPASDTDCGGGSGSGGDSTDPMCNWTLRYDCTEFCTNVTVCATYACSDC
jgi:hypothetical protein